MGASQLGQRETNNCFVLWCAEKQKRLKQAKEQAADEIEKYRQDRDRQFKDFEAKVFGELALGRRWAMIR